MAITPPYEGTTFDRGSRSIDGLSRSLKGISGNLQGISGSLVDGGYGFVGRQPPSQSGLGTRQSQVPPTKGAVTTRQVMRWLVPERPIVEMYINPKQVVYNYKKNITQTRVKGGYVFQYWGEDLTTLTINGTTGTSGIEGINVLLDVYRNEQLMFDPYALFLQAERDKASQQDVDNLLFGDGGVFGLNNVPILGDVVGSAIDTINGSIASNVVNARNKPTLASLAFTVEMYWGGEVYRGFFESFNVTESADNIGLFDYNFTFKVTQKRGFRNNFLAWHKHPSYGQSNWSRGGPPLSYGRLVNEYATPTRNAEDQPQAFQAVAGASNQESNNNRNIMASEIIDAFII